MARTKTKDDKPKIGRPRRADGKLSTKMVGLWLTPDEHASYLAAAEAADQKVSEWIRAACSAELARTARRKRS